MKNNIQTENSLIKDLSSLTNLSNNFFLNLSDITYTLIGHYVHSSQVELENIIKINLGFGFLLISVENNKIEYKFVPTDKLEMILRNVLLHKKDPLVNKLETKINEKVLNTYKELL